MYFEGKATIPKLTAIFVFWSRLSLSTPCNIKQQVGVRAHDPHCFFCHALGTVTGEGRHESCRLLTWQGCDNLMVWCVARGDLSDALNAVPFPGGLSGHLALVLHWPTPWNLSHSGLG